MEYLVGGLIAAIGVVFVVAGMTHSGGSIFTAVTGKTQAATTNPTSSGTGAQATFIPAATTPTLPKLA